MPGPAPATNFAVRITKWTAPTKVEDPYLSEPASPAMSRVLLELSPQSTLAAEEAARQAVAAAAAAAQAAEQERRQPPPAYVAFVEEQARVERERAEFQQRVRQDIAREAQIANQGPAPVWRLASEVEAEERAREEAAQAQAQVAEFDAIAEPPAPAPPPLPAPRGTVMYSDPLV